MVVSHCILLIVFSNSKFSTRRFLANVQPLSGKIVANHWDHHGHTVFRSCPQCLYLSTRMHQPRGRLLGHCLNRSILSLPLFFAVVIFCRLPFHPAFLPSSFLRLLRRAQSVFPEAPVRKSKSSSEKRRSDGERT